jgi:hypothetical protein
MAKRDKASHEQDGLEHHREITNTGGHLDDDGLERSERQRTGAFDENEGAPSTNKTGDDAWHHRANRRSEKSEGSEPMRGGNTPR